MGIGERREAVSRRRLITLAGTGVVLGAGSPLIAAVLTEAEQANAAVVSKFCATWAMRNVDALMPFLADNISYRITETTPAIVGRAAFRDRIGSILERLTSIEFAVVDTVAKGPVVLNERHDTLVAPQRTQRFHAVGMFFLVDGKIAEWTDYVIERG